MAEVREEGLQVARHLHREIYEVRADERNATFRILFAPEGKKGRALLALEGFSKKTRTTPRRLIELAERRLMEWRGRREEVPVEIGSDDAEIGTCERLRNGVGSPGAARGPVAVDRVSQREALWLSVER